MQRVKKNKLNIFFKWAIIGLILLSIVGVVILSNMDPNTDYEGNHISTTPRTVTIVLIDGLSKEIFNSELEKGKLPNLKKLIARSTYVHNGIGSFPSMTGYAFYPFITGMDAPESGIYGLRWFDRTLDKGNLRNYVGRTNIQMNTDITDKYQNIFEYFSDYYTASVNTFMNRGVHHPLKTGWAHATAKYSHESIFPLLRAIPMMGEEMSKDHFQHETLVTDLASSQLEKNPKVQWVTYPSLDAHNHVHGTDKVYYQLMSHIDEEVGRLIDTIEALGQDDRMVVIVSDHGISDVDININIPEILGDSLGFAIERGPSTHLDTDELSTPIEEFVEDDGYFVINGNLSAYLYMTDQSISGKEGWRKKIPGNLLSSYPTHSGVVDLPSFIARVEGIDLVAYQYDSNTVAVINGNSEARIILTEGEKLIYQHLSGDPLAMEGYLKQGQSYNFDSLLTMTANSDYPNAIARIWALMSKTDGPDIVMTTRKGYDLARDYEIFVDNYKGGHGGIHASLLNVPYILFVPSESPRKVAVARSEDVGATILDYLGIEPSYRLSGISLLSD